MTNRKHFYLNRQSAFSYKINNFKIEQQCYSVTREFKRK